MLSRLAEFSDCRRLSSNGMLNKTRRLAPDFRLMRYSGIVEGERAVRKGRHGMGMAILYILIGGIVGSILGQVLTPVWHPLGRALVTLGSRPKTAWSIDLGFLAVQVGAWIQLNVLGVIGLIAGLLWFRRGA